MRLGVLSLGGITVAQIDLAVDCLDEVQPAGVLLSRLAHAIEGASDVPVVVRMSDEQLIGFEPIDIGAAPISDTYGHTGSPIWYGMNEVEMIIPNYHPIQYLLSPIVPISAGISRE